MLWNGAEGVDRHVLLGTFNPHEVPIVIMSGVNSVHVGVRVNVRLGWFSPRSGVRVLVVVLIHVKCLLALALFSALQTPLAPLPL
jgi:hypothetical protein